MGSTASWFGERRIHRHSGEPRLYTRAPTARALVQAEAVYRAAARPAAEFRSFRFARLREARRHGVRGERKVNSKYWTPYCTEFMRILCMKPHAERAGCTVHTSLFDLVVA